jgi:hypothetical protein
VHGAEKQRLYRIRAQTAYDNVSKLRLLERYRFRFSQSSNGVNVLILDLPVSGLRNNS